jgi:deoxyribodipyrimidine photolyase-related protein
LHPKQVIGAVIEHWQQHKKSIDIAQVEGFIRQILGWREFVRGIYWANMPAYNSANALEANRELPGYFWSGKTQMRCMQKSLGQSLDYAYAHHIQRLMVIGNFCLLAGIDPEQVDQWYLGVYIDAIEWVELPNTRGMSQFADGGLLASKPYAGSGQYINRMSDYCKSCHYDIKQRFGENSCPFNSLYWHFIDRHRQRFEANPRMKMVYNNWQKQSPGQRKKILQQGQHYLDHLATL